MRDVTVAKSRHLRPPQDRHRSTSRAFENTMRCRKSGKVWLVSDFDDAGEDPPEDVDDDSLYLVVPGKTELDLGRHLALEFTTQELPDCSSEVKGFFARPGAYARFKDSLAERGVWRLGTPSRRRG